MQKQRTITRQELLRLLRRAQGAAQERVEAAGKKEEQK
jgi:hypothetical protein